MTILSAAILLWLVMDPLGNVPLFVAALRRVEPQRLERVLARELSIAYVVMVVFLLTGPLFLRVLMISEPALTIAGGIVLFLIAVRMVFPQPGSDQDEISGEPFVVPLAIPYVAGPSVLATLLLLMSREPRRWVSWLVALTIAWAVSAVVLLAAGRIRAHLSPRGMVAVERLMGMVLVTIATQMFLNGVATFIGQLPAHAAG